MPSKLLVGDAPTASDRGDGIRVGGIESGQITQSFPSGSRYGSGGHDEAEGARHATDVP